MIMKIPLCKWLSDVCHAIKTHIIALMYRFGVKSLGTMCMTLIFLLSIYSFIRMSHSACVDMVEGAHHVHARIQKVLSEGVQI